MVTVTLTRFRLGLVTGVCFTFGLTDLVSGIEYLLLDGRLFEWNDRLAILTIVLGVIYILLGIAIANWSKSVMNLMDVEGQ
jgi:hypothetical protein